MKSLKERWATAKTDEDFAWACLITNVVGVPGVGSLMARRWVGVPQLALSVAGGVLTTYWLVAFLAAEVRTWEIPPPGGPALSLALWGLGLFALGWIWALASSVAILRAARRAATPR